MNVMMKCQATVRKSILLVAGDREKHRNHTLILKTSSNEIFVPFG
jgi:hypothetical protein